MKKSNAKIIPIISAHQINVAELIETYNQNKVRLKFITIGYNEERAILRHQKTIETILTALNVPIP